MQDNAHPERRRDHCLRAQRQVDVTGREQPAHGRRPGVDREGGSGRAINTVFLRCSGAGVCPTVCSPASGRASSDGGKAS